MISCPSSEDLLAFHKNELECEEIGLHIDRCQKCSSELLTLSKHLSLYSQIRTPQFVPQDVDWSKLINNPSTEKDKKPFAVLLQIAASLLLLAVVTVSLLQDTASSPQLTYGFAGQSDKNIKAGDSVTFGDTLYTSNAIAKISMDKISCDLAPNTSVYLENANSVQLVQGSVYFHVVPGNALTIKTERGTIQVLGTKFLVTATNKKTKVSVYRGKVKFTNHNNQEYILTQGQSINSSLAKIQKNREEIPSWVTQPLFLRIETQKQKDITIFATNLTMDTLYLKRFSGTPNFLFHVRNLQTNEEYQTPVFSENKKTFIVKPRQTQNLKISKAQLLKNPGKYEVSLIFQDQIQGNNSWSGIIRSSSIVIDYN
ncbi:FecR domain-containing protein [Candidatus Uabimicrobium amorphum]|uniref:Sensor n=1 Tax=Uabimicrobium amorphum TaxID=2596890 RepID=A0A5S9IKH6_UABAM|nr:FecR family protein [Candidatus Uabimicrobium amorphum]BBM82255.1 sensor [Candidatus Uabimicrobium amorphum]